jgi:transcriptional regulator with XRE-family HTH domain
MTTGEQFARARALLGLSLDELAVRTKIRAERLAAIEDMDAARLPDTFYVRGYVRTIAGELGLDPGEATERYFAEFKEHSLHRECVTDTPAATRIMTTEGRAIAQLLEQTATHEVPAPLAPEGAPIWSRRIAVAALTMLLAVTVATGLWTLAGQSKPTASSRAVVAAPPSTQSPSAAASEPLPVDQEADRADQLAASQVEMREASRTAPPAATLKPAADRSAATRRRRARIAAAIAAPVDSIRVDAVTPIAPVPPRAQIGSDTAHVDAAPVPFDGELSGPWVLTNEIDQSNVASYRDLTLGFRLQLDQNGNRVRGRGFKWLENGRPVAAAGQTPIAVDGTIEGNRLALTFTERGLRRISRGNIELQLAKDGSFHGRFSSDVAGSTGRARAVRVQ